MGVKKNNVEPPRRAGSRQLATPEMVIAWARGLSDRELAGEVEALRRKCKNAEYRGGLAGHLLAAVESEVMRKKLEGARPNDDLQGFTESAEGFQLKKLPSESDGKEGA